VIPTKAPSGEHGLARHGTSWLAFGWLAHSLAD